jgi:hypothetical protein
MPAILYAYNITIALDSTGFSPYYLIFGREPLSPLDSVLPTYSPPHNPEFLTESHQKLSKATTA